MCRVDSAEVRRTYGVHHNSDARMLRRVAMTAKETMDGLENTDQPFRTLFESSPDAIFIEDLEGYVVDCNPAAARLHMTTRGKLIGRHVSELVPPEHRREVILYDTPVPEEFE